MERLSDEGFAAWVAASCERSGVPLFVTDTSALVKVGRLVGSRLGAPARRPSAEEAPGRRSQFPVDVDAGWVDEAGSRRSGADRDVVDQCPNDRDLSA